jgi:hypothetical protein
MRQTISSRPALLVIASVMLVTACGGPSNDTAPAESQGAEAAPQGELPPGHPSLDQAAGQGAIEPPPPGAGTGAAAMTWTAPEGWVSEAPANPMRKAQYSIGDQGLCVVYYFGPGQGGDALSNAQRWAEQFAQPDGRPAAELLKTEEIDVNGIPVLLVEVTGTYRQSTMMGGPEESMPDYMLLGAVAEGPDANWFFKFTGPKKTVRAEEEAFQAMIRSLGTGG